MSITLSFCLSNIGNVPIDGIVNVYGNTDNYVTPIQSGVYISGMTGTQCPYSVVAPDGTNKLRIIHQPTQTRICVDYLDPCTDCNLGFAQYKTNSIGNITAGHLTGTCGTQITDYFINWYGPQQNAFDPQNPQNNIAFTSGYGSRFSGYTGVHPMIGAQAYPVLPGYYQPVIMKARIDGVNYSLTGGTGTTQANLNCISNAVVVSAWTCSDTTDVPYPLSLKYSVLIQYDTDGLYNTRPDSLVTRLILDPSQDNLAFRFDGLSVFDNLTIKYSGTNYSQEFLLENINVGVNSVTSYLPNTNFPKGWGTSTFVKILTFTGLTRSSEDFLTFTITPNQQNNATSWKLY